MRRVLILLLVTMFCSAGASAETRVALVIGNSAYPTGPLPNPANDAKLMADTLRSLGFQVIFRRDADQNGMKRAIQEFGATLEKGGPTAIGLFYYAGHGVALNGVNFLIPVSAQIEREGDVEIEGVSADWVIEQMRYARNGLNIVILDACRNNPFVRSMRSASRGLAGMDAPAGILIAYSTAPGQVAADGNGKNSPYTEALSTAMTTLHEPVEQVFKRVRVGVMSSTANKQVPWEASSLTGDFYFSAAPAASPAAAAAKTATAAAPAARPADPPADASRATGSGGFFANLFGGKSEDPKPAPPVRVAAAGATLAGARALPVFQTLGIQVPDLVSGHDYPRATLQGLIEKTPRQVTLGNTPAQKQEALALCRQYDKGCQASQFSDEAPRNVTLKPFQLDATPVSVAAFRAFVEATLYQTDAEKAGVAYAKVGNSLKEVSGGTWRNGIKQRKAADDTAVIGVSFGDAQAYCRFRGARLPTEDEWEYVARGPARHTFPWGDDAAPAQARPRAAPRIDDGPAGGIGGRYQGLAGNVWQWVDTAYQSQYRILKGGSWLETNPANKRAAGRLYEVPARADDDSGFRCARSVAAWPDADLWMAELR